MYVTSAPARAFCHAVATHGVGQRAPVPQRLEQPAARARSPPPPTPAPRRGPDPAGAGRGTPWRARPAPCPAGPPASAARAVLPAIQSRRAPCAVPAGAARRRRRSPASSLRARARDPRRRRRSPPGRIAEQRARVPGPHIGRGRSRQGVRAGRRPAGRTPRSPNAAANASWNGIAEHVVGHLLRLGDHEPALGPDVGLVAGGATVKTSSSSAAASARCSASTEVPKPSQSDAALGLRRAAQPLEREGERGGVEIAGARTAARTASAPSPACAGGSNSQARDVDARE